MNSPCASFIPLTCTSAIWGWCLLRSHPAPPHGARSGYTAVTDCWWACSSHRVSSVPTLEETVIGWLQHPLSTDMAGNIFSFTNSIWQFFSWLRIPWLSTKQPLWSGLSPGVFHIVQSHWSPACLCQDTVNSQRVGTIYYSFQCPQCWAHWVPQKY